MRASPWDLLKTTPEVEALERVPQTHYEPPPDVELTLVDDVGRVICHVSPDAGWPTLKEFLEMKDGGSDTGGKDVKTLTVGMYDFTAPHIVKAVTQAVATPPAKLNLVIQHGSAARWASQRR